MPMPLLVPVMAMESADVGTRRRRQLASTGESIAGGEGVAARPAESRAAGRGVI